jgi:uncharacterized protein (DUF1697 family)
LQIYVALLRAVNVGGTGLLPMKELSSMCGDLGFMNVRTYIQSGNVVFQSKLAEGKIRAKLEESLTKRLGKKADVIVRTAAELVVVLKRNPFANEEPSKVAVVFFSESIPKGKAESVTAPGGERVKQGKKELYIFYPEGMGRSKLKLPVIGTAGTARNMRTVQKLVALTEALDETN